MSLYRLDFLQLLVASTVYNYDGSAGIHTLKVLNLTK